MAQAALELLQHHEGIDAALLDFAYQAVRELVLDVARRDALHPLAPGLLAQLLDIVLGEAGQRLAIVELELLQPRQVHLLGILEASEHRPHRRHLERVRSDVLAADLLVVEVALIDLDLLIEPGDVGDVDLDGAVAQCLHELVVLQAAELGLVGVRHDDLIDVGLREFLGLDLMLLARAEQVVEEGHVELEHLNELDEPAVGDVELAVEVEGARIGVRAVDGDLAVVDVPRQLGRVLVLFVLRLEGADGDAIRLADQQATDANVLDDPLVIPLVLEHQLVVDVAAGRAEVALDHDLAVVGQLAVDLLDEGRAELLRDQLERLLVHRAGHGLVVDVALEHPRRATQRAEPLPHPGEGIEGPLRSARVVLEPLLEQPADGRLRGADRAVQQQDTPLGAVAQRGGLEYLHELHQRQIQTVDRILPAPNGVVEEVVVDDLLLVLGVAPAPEGGDHVIEALERIPRQGRVLRHHLQVIGERALPVKILVERVILAFLNVPDDVEF